MTITMIITIISIFQSVLLIIISIKLIKISNLNVKLNKKLIQSRRENLLKTSQAERFSHIAIEARERYLEEKYLREKYLEEKNEKNINLKIKKICTKENKISVELEGNGKISVPIDECFILEWLNNCKDEKALHGIYLKALSQKSWVRAGCPEIEYGEE